MDCAKMITPTMVRELLSYDPSTGVFIWRARSSEWFKQDGHCRRWNNRYAGRRAGVVKTQHDTGYQMRVIRLLKSTFQEHRLAWMWMTGEKAPGQIDHRDRDATSNRWDNLRASSSFDNGRNRSMNRNNSSGVTGVRWHKAARKWRATCRLNYKLLHLGMFDELDEAAMAVMEFRAAHGFDPMHGMEVAHYHHRAAV